MKVKSSKPRGQRIFKCTKFRHNVASRKIRRPFWIEPVGRGWWFDLENGEWKQEYNSEVRMKSAYYAMTHSGFKDIYSLKAAIRLIYKWSVPKGTKFRVSLPFVGYWFIITK